jgi:5-formyltetrahydrofolate cyclo-ligase
MMVSKLELRRQLLKTRQSIPDNQWQEKSYQLCHNLFNSSIYQQAKTILAYFSFRQEADLSYLYSCNTNNKNINWGFPRCVGNSLIYHTWQKKDQLTIGKYGIREPQAEAPILEPTTVDLILVPCVACDYQGYRLGYGGGYYDRFLSTPEWQEKPTVGIIFNFAFLPKLPIESWDKKLHAICTETEFINLR